MNKNELKADHVDAILAHLDGEPGRVAAARIKELEAERDALRAQVTGAVERLDEFGSAPTLADGIQAMRLRLLDYRAQVERVRTIAPYERPSYREVPAEYVEGYNDAVRDVRDALDGN